jgi:hypothetical protein
MTIGPDPLSEHEIERVGRIRTLKSLEIGNQVEIYYNHSTLLIELHIKKFENSLTETAKLTLSMNETRQLIELLDKSIALDLKRLI